MIVTINIAVFIDIVIADTIAVTIYYIAIGMFLLNLLLL